MDDERGLVPADLATLATAINDEHRACETALRTGLSHAIRAGELLIRARSLCQHGTWLPWLHDNFEGSERLAQGYMRVARELPKLATEDPQRVADPTFRQALAELAGPVPAVDIVVRRLTTELDRATERFIRDIDEALRRARPVRHLYWVRQAVARGHAALNEVESYAGPGRSDLDTFLARLCPFGAVHGDSAWPAPIWRTSLRRDFLHVGQNTDMQKLQCDTGGPSVASREVGLRT